MKVKYCGAVLLAIVVCVVYFSVQQVEGLKCYQCAYKKDKFKEGCGKRKLVQCDPKEPDMRCTTWIHRDGRGSMGCDWEMVMEPEVCHTGDFKDGTTELTCQCNTDGCNSDPKNNTRCTNCDTIMTRGFLGLMHRKKK